MLRRQSIVAASVVKGSWPSENTEAMELMPHKAAITEVADRITATVKYTGTDMGQPSVNLLHPG